MEFDGLQSLIIEDEAIVEINWKGRSFSEFVLSATFLVTVERPILSCMRFQRRDQLDRSTSRYTMCN